MGWQTGQGRASQPGSAAGSRRTLATAWGPEQGPGQGSGVEAVKHDPDRSLIRVCERVIRLRRRYPAPFLLENIEGMKLDVHSRAAQPATVALAARAAAAAPAVWAARRGDQAGPVRRGPRAAPGRAPSLIIARLTWVLAVAGLSTMASAISSLDRPCATRATT